MYDDSITASNYRNIHPHHQHWYDEPPYESDPDDFLMSGIGPVASIQVNFIPYTAFSYIVRRSLKIIKRGIHVALSTVINYTIAGTTRCCHLKKL